MSAKRILIVGLIVTCLVTGGVLSSTQIGWGGADTIDPYWIVGTWESREADYASRSDITGFEGVAAGLCTYTVNPFADDVSGSFVCMQRPSKKIVSPKLGPMHIVPEYQGVWKWMGNGIWAFRAEGIFIVDASEEVAWLVKGWGTLEYLESGDIQEAYIPRVESLGGSQRPPSGTRIQHLMRLKFDEDAWRENGPLPVRHLP